MEIIFVLVWIVCGVIAYGGAFADFQRRFPSLADEERREDMVRAIIIGTFGPIGLFATVFISGFYKYGFKFY